MSDKSASSVINTPSGGGAQQGLGEKFSPDLFTGTGNFSIPIAVPPGRNGFQPQIGLSYSTGNGNSAFGLGWGLSIPGVMRKTAKGVPTYNEEKDSFILSGAEDLVPIEEGQGFTQYRPRTEGLFARIYRYLDGQNDYWKVISKDGLTSYYGTPNVKGTDDAIVADPDDSRKVFHWKLTKTVDLFGNLIEYSYTRDAGSDDYHHWDNCYLSEIRYVDYGDRSAPSFLVKVQFEYEDRPDPFSEYKPGFEIRITKRCKNIKTYTCPTGQEILTRTYHLQYIDEVVTNEAEIPLNKASILSRVEVEGHDDTESEFLPPLDMRYTRYKPNEQKFFSLKGKDLPALSLGAPGYELVDLFGNGLQDIVEMQGQYIRYWRNLGNGEFDRPRLMKEAPAGIDLADPNVQMIDADGDGRADLMVHSDKISGYFPSRFGASWDHKSFQKYKFAPSFSLADPNVKLLDLDGDGVTDALRSGASFECFFNDQYEGWNETRRVNRKQISKFPNINFDDPRIKWGDMTGDGLQSPIYVHNNVIKYWPSMGYGNFGMPVTMRNCPKLPYNYDPKRILIGDVDGDGIDDIVYVDYNKVTVWINCSGNGWSDPIVIKGTPPVSDADSIRLVDLLGQGVSGILWSKDRRPDARASMFYLDLTGGVKPYVMNEMENNMGSLTRIAYASSTKHYLRDQQKPATRWKTHLPFPVQVVDKVEVIDQISKGKLSTVYQYHHGYWDGGEREFRGFARVDQRDTETFQDFNALGLHPETGHNTVDFEQYNPPIETRNWFHLGPVGDEFGDWHELDLSHEYWAEDPQVLSRPDDVVQLLKELPRRAKRDAIRCWRGSQLRSELYTIDTQAADIRPYTVTETQTSIRLEFAHDDTLLGKQGLKPAKGTSGYIFFSFGFANRSTQWERGNDPMTQLNFTGDFDAYGQARKQLAIAVPRTRQFNFMDEVQNATETFFITTGETEFIYKDENMADHGRDLYMVNRSSQAKGYELVNTGRSSVPQLVNFIFQDTYKSVAAASVVYTDLLSHSINYYDGTAYSHLPFGQLGDYGVAVQTETLVMTDDMVTDIYDTRPECFKASPDWSGSGAPSGFEASLQNGDDRLGYVQGTESYHVTDGWYVPSTRQKFDFQDAGLVPRGLLLESRDIFEVYATIEYDDYDLLPVKAIQHLTTYGTAGDTLETTAQYDYRVMQADLITDPNGNRSAFAFTPLGLLHKSAVMGKSTESKGDTLAHPSVWMEYDFFAFKNHRQPVWVHTYQRINHWHDTVNDDVIEAVEYSDGFGRLLQTRSLAEDVIFGDATFGSSGLPADPNDSNQAAVGTQRGASSLPNVRVSGWTVYDNKGRPVEQYEPFFSTGFEYRAVTDSQKGQKVRMYYDPRGQVVRTLNPDGSEQRVIFGIPDNISSPPEHYSLVGLTPTPWESYTYDANDLSGITHPTESTAYATHRYTPSSVVLDALGRSVRTISRLSVTDTVEMSYEYDIRGNVLSITDALLRKVFINKYNLANQPLRVEHIDAGTKFTVTDAMGKPIWAYDDVANGAGKGSQVYNNYDHLGRPMRSYAQDVDLEGFTVRSAIVYGDDATNGPADPADTNHLGQAYKSYDESGLTTILAYDFKGNPLAKTQQVIKDDTILEVINDAIAANDPIVPYRTNWGLTPWTQESGLLEGSYRTDSEYDALNRVTKITLPEDINTDRKEVEPTYNRAGAIEAVSFDSDVYVERIAYNAKGQRLMIAYGNDLMTRYTYDTETFRMERQRTESFTKSGLTYTSAGSVKEDRVYTYDLVGNILTQKELGTGVGVGGSSELLRAFSYDPLYRLLQATGRECSAGVATPWAWDSVTNNCADVNNSTQYRRKYTYDKMGNLTQMQHIGDSSFTRNYTISDTNNRMTQLVVGATTYDDYTYDNNGNLIQEYSNRHFSFDQSDRLRAFTDVPDGSSAPTIYEQYVYGAGGRVKKFTWKSATNYDVTVYIDGVFEHLKKVTVSTNEEKNYTHIMDGGRRIAIVRTGDFSDDLDGMSQPIVPYIQYQLEDHLQSVGIRTSDTGATIDREEYFPYGETSLTDLKKKRYRFTGKERDSESGLYYFGQRFYSPWTCRFISTDPKSSAAPNLTPYHYCSNNPINRVDPDGMQDEPSGGGEGVVTETKVTGAIEGGAIKNAASDVVKGKEQAVEDAQSKYDNLVTKHQGDLKKKDIRKYEKESGLKNAKKDLADWKGIESKINDMIETFKTVMPDKYEYLNSLPVNININYNPSIGPSGENNPQSTKIPASPLTIMQFGSDVENTVWTGEFDGDIEITLWGGGVHSPFKTNYLANEFGDIDYFFKNVKPNDPDSYQKWATTGSSKYPGYWNDPTGAGQMSFKYQSAFENTFNSVRKNYPVDKVDRINWIIRK